MISYHLQKKYLPYRRRSRSISVSSSSIHRADESDPERGSLTFLPLFPKRKEIGARSQGGLLTFSSARDNVSFCHAD